VLANDVAFTNGRERTVEALVDRGRRAQVLRINGRAPNKPRAPNAMKPEIAWRARITKFYFD
jgi:hypothetical protein